MIKWFKRKLFESRVQSAIEMSENLIENKPRNMSEVIVYWGLADEFMLYVLNGGSICRLYSELNTLALCRQDFKDKKHETKR